MKKTLALIAIATLSLAQAAQVDCSTPVVVNLEWVGYQEKAEFPNSPKTLEFNAWNLKQPRSFCGVGFSAKGNTMSLKAEQLEYFAYMTTVGRISNTIILAGTTTRPGKKDGVKVTVSIDKYYTTYNAQVLVPSDLTKTAAVAARVDGGKLQPLYWPGVGYATVEFPKTIKTLDVYLKTNEPSNWQRVTLNFKSPEITVYRKFAFPTK